jgi:hypothetical protein
MKIFGYEPSMILYGANALVSLLVAYGLDLSKDQVSAISVIVTAVLAIATTVMTRPVVVSGITGAVGTLLAAVAAFGLHLTGDQIGATVTVLSIGLALLLRANVSPAAAPAAPQPRRM